VFEQDLTVDGNRVTLTAWRAQAVPRRTGRPSRGR
jgi:hypothetical protein